MTDANLLMSAALMIAGAFVAWRVLPRALRGAPPEPAAVATRASAPALQA